jgi:hypothetical protein
MMFQVSRKANLPCWEVYFTPEKVQIATSWAGRVLNLTQGFQVLLDTTFATQLLGATAGCNFQGHQGIHCY